jgi:phosphoserine phosphatase RsbU/P
MNTRLLRFREVFRRVSRVDVAAFVLVLIGGAILVAERVRPLPGQAAFFKYLASLAAFYLLFRLIGWSRTRLLWSLRNRLIVAYLFIAVVPVLLLLTLAILAAQILYSQLAAYLLYQDLQQRVELIGDTAEHIAAAQKALAPSATDALARQVLTVEARASHDEDLPGLEVEFSNDASLLRRIAAGENHFVGLVQTGEQLTLLAIRETQTARGKSIVRLSAPLNAEFLERVAPELGPIQLSLAERVTGTPPAGILYSSGDSRFYIGKSIGTRRRTLQPPGFWIDPQVGGLSKFDVVYLPGEGAAQRGYPVFVLVHARPSQLNHRIFSSVGEFSNLYLVLFALVAVVFLLIEIAALVTGITLTRTITKAVDELYRATQYVSAQDFTHRVRIERRDQLGVLGASFNQMTSSIGSLIEEQRERQRLENEISIAREVQAQLFPQKLPSVPGVEIEAVCRAARVVSGDYYDFIQMGPKHLALVVADISGKGISAALLMASLQAALRSQVLVPGSELLSSAELVSRLNRHLTRNTADDRFATLFLAVFDSEARKLRYTNAGHLPALCISNGASARLEIGGMVLGVVEDYAYEEGCVVVAPGALLIGYSDGLVEPENVYGEQFGIHRLEDAALRRQSAPVSAVAESLITAADEWAGTPEQADDMTVVVARFG